MTIIYPIVGNGFKQLKGIIRISILIVFVVVSKIGANFIASLYSRNDYSQQMNNGNGYLMLVYFFVIILIVELFDNISFRSKNDAHKELLLALMYPQVLATAVSVATRITKYSETFLLAMLPEVATKNGKKNGNIFLVMMISVLSVMFFYYLFLDTFFPYYTHFANRI